MTYRVARDEAYAPWIWQVFKDGDLFARYKTLKEANECVQREREAEKIRTERDNDVVNHPKHYTSHPSGVECIQVTEHMNFNKGNAVKYIWRAGDKGDEIQDLEKARWYLDREIARLKGMK